MAALYILAQIAEDHTEQESHKAIDPTASQLKNI